MSEPDQELGTTTEPVGTDWAAALSETLKAASEPDPSTETPTETVVEPGDEPVTESRDDALEPLESWSDEVKDRFRSLDRETQQFLLDRERDIQSHLTKRTQELSEIQKRYQRLDDVLKPYDEVARRQGIDLTPHVAQALQYYMAYQSDPASTLRALIQAANLQPEALGFGEQDKDPTIRALRERLDKTERELASLKQGTTEATESHLVAQIQAFKDAKDESGNPKHPYFDQVRTLMAPLVAQGKSLEEAYAEAVWAVPEYRQAQEKAAREKAEKEAKAKAEKARLEKLKNAKKAAETLPASDTEHGTGKKPFVGGQRGWEEALRETAAKLQ